MSYNAELDIRDDESEIPRLAAVAFRNARMNAVRLGFRVLYIKDGELVEVQSGNKERVLRTMRETIHAKKGTRLTLNNMSESQV